MLFYLIKVKLSVDNVFCAIVTFLRHKAIVLMNSQIALDILISVISEQYNSKMKISHIACFRHHVKRKWHITYYLQDDKMKLIFENVG